MTDEIVSLNLIAARSLRAERFDFIAGQRDLVSGFTASEVAGHGSRVRLETTAEQVKGHADQVLVRMVLEKDNAAQLLARLRTAFAGAGLVYWTSPVTGFGELDET